MIRVSKAQLSLLERNLAGARGDVHQMLAARDTLISKYGDFRPPAVVEVPFDPLGVSEQDLKDMGIF